HRRRACAGGSGGVVPFHYVIRMRGQATALPDIPLAIGAGRAYIMPAFRSLRRAVMAETFRVACVQNTAERDMAPSIAALEPLIRGAAADGANLIVLPEHATMLEPKDPLVLRKAVTEEAHPGLPRFRTLAQETGAWILVGSLLVNLPGENRVA